MRAYICLVALLSIGPWLSGPVYARDPNKGVCSDILAKKTRLFRVLAEEKRNSEWAATLKHVHDTVSNEDHQPIFRRLIYFLVYEKAISFGRRSFEKAMDSKAKREGLLAEMEDAITSEERYVIDAFMRELVIVSKLLPMEE